MKRLIISLAFIIMASTAFADSVEVIGRMTVTGGSLQLAEATTYWTDNFNRTDSSTLGPNWTASVNGKEWAISSNTALNTSDSSETHIERWSANSFNNRQYSQVKILTNNSNQGPAARIQSGSASGYGIGFSSSGTVIKFWRIDNEAITQLGGDFTWTWSASEAYKLGADGSTLTLYIDGVAKDTRTDATYSSGSAGIWKYYANPSQLDDWQGGNLP